MLPFYLDTSGSISDEMLKDFKTEIKSVMHLDRLRRAKFALWQRKHKPERARNRIRRASRKANR